MNKIQHYEPVASLDALDNVATQERPGYRDFMQKLENAGWTTAEGQALVRFRVTCLGIEDRMCVVWTAAREDETEEKS